MQFNIQKSQTQPQPQPHLLNQSQPHHQLHINNYLQQYQQLLKQFNLFRQQTILQKETIFNNFQKNKHVNETFLKKLQKKYEHLLKEQKNKLQKQKQKYLKTIQQQKQSYEINIQQKKNIIQELSNFVIQLQREKRQIIQENTKSLLELARSQDKDSHSHSNHLNHSSNSNQEILKMYQYLLEENVALKKQLTYYQGGTQNSINSPNKMKYHQNKNNSKRSQEIFYTEQSNKKAKSPNSLIDIEKNYSFINSRNGSKQEKNLHRVKSNTSQISSNSKKMNMNMNKQITNPKNTKNSNGNNNKSSHVFIEQKQQIMKNSDHKKKTNLKPAIPIGSMHKKKPV